MSSLRKELCPWIKPQIIADEFIKKWGEEGFLWLDGDGSELGRWITISANPVKTVCCRGLPNQRSSNPFSILRNLEKGHWTGWLSYEAGAWTEINNPWKESPLTTLWMASHDPILKFDLISKELWIEGTSSNRFETFKQYVNKISINYKNQIYPRKKENHSQCIDIPLDAWEWITKKDIYEENVNKVKSLIKEGDIFQANLTACCQANLPPNFNFLEIFYKVRKDSPAPFGGLLIGSEASKGEAIISASPERFLKVLSTGEVESRPIKGTRPRNESPQEDAKMAIELICSSKDRAENIMIVDLLRNDLGKVCKPGSIHVPQLVELESYAHVHHLTSVIKGTLNAEKTWVDLLEAAWPGGSISGAPKARACQRLYELEPIARGPYCGSLLNINWEGNFDSNILIRSFIIKNSRIQAHAGCGIVADSDASQEAQELIWKVMPLLKSLQ